MSQYEYSTLPSSASALPPPPPPHHQYHHQYHRTPFPYQHHPYHLRTYSHHHHQIDHRLLDPQQQGSYQHHYQHQHQHHHQPQQQRQQLQQLQQQHENTAEITQSKKRTTVDRTLTSSSSRSSNSTANTINNSPTAMMMYNPTALPEEMDGADGAPPSTRKPTNKENHTIYEQYDNVVVDHEQAKYEQQQHHDQILLPHQEWNDHHYRYPIGQPNLTSEPQQQQQQQQPNQHHYPPPVYPRPTRNTGTPTTSATSHHQHQPDMTMTTNTSTWQEQQQQTTTISPPHHNISQSSQQISSLSATEQIVDSVVVDVINDYESNHHDSHQQNHYENGEEGRDGRNTNSNKNTSRIKYGTKHEMDELFRFCCSDKWSAVLQRLEQKPYLALNTITMGNNISTTILHQAITKRANKKERIQVIMYILRTTPIAATIRNGYGSLPLHAVGQRNIRMDSQTKEYIIRELVLAYPQSVVEIGGSGKRTPLHIIFTDYYSPSLIQELIDIAPNACFMKDKKGYLPAHVACSRHCSPEKLRMLLAVHPHAIYEQANDKHTLLSLAKETSTPSHPNHSLIEEIHRQMEEIDKIGQPPTTGSDCSRNGSNYSRDGGGNVGATLTTSDVARAQTTTTPSRSGGNNCWEFPLFEQPYNHHFNSQKLSNESTTPMMVSANSMNSEGARIPSYFQNHHQNHRYYQNVYGGGSEGEHRNDEVYQKDDNDMNEEDDRSLSSSLNTNPVTIENPLPDDRHDVSLTPTSLFGGFGDDCNSSSLNRWNSSRSYTLGTAHSTSGAGAATNAFAVSIPRKRKVPPSSQPTLRHQLLTTNTAPLESKTAETVSTAFGTTATPRRRSSRISNNDNFSIATSSCSSNGYSGSNTTNNTKSNNIPAADLLLHFSRRSTPSSPLLSPSPGRNKNLKSRTSTNKNKGTLLTRSRKIPEVTAPQISTTTYFSYDNDDPAMIPKNITEV